MKMPTQTKTSASIASCAGSTHLTKTMLNLNVSFVFYLLQTVEECSTHCKLQCFGNVLAVSKPGGGSWGGGGGRPYIYIYIYTPTTTTTSTTTTTAKNHNHNPNPVDNQPQPKPTQRSTTQHSATQHSTTTRHGTTHTHNRTQHKCTTHTHTKAIRNTYAPPHTHTHNTHTHTRHTHTIMVLASEVRVGPSTVRNLWGWTRLLLQGCVDKQLTVLASFCWEGATWFPPVHTHGPWWKEKTASPKLTLISTGAQGGPHIVYLGNMKHIIRNHEGLNLRWAMNTWVPLDAVLIEACRSTDPSFDSGLQNLSQVASWDSPGNWHGTQMVPEQIAIRNVVLGSMSICRSGKKVTACTPRQIFRRLESHPRLLSRFSVSRSLPGFKLRWRERGLSPPLVGEVSWNPTRVVGRNEQRVSFWRRPKQTVKGSRQEPINSKIPTLMHSFGSCWSYLHEGRWNKHRSSDGTVLSRCLFYVLVRRRVHQDIQMLKMPVSAIVCHGGLGEKKHTREKPDLRFALPSQS